MLKLTFFPIEIYTGGNQSAQPIWKVIIQEIQFIPLLTIDIPTFILNVIMLIPFGVYLPLLNRKLDSSKKAAKYGFLLSLSIEVLQLIIEVTLGSGRITDINDIIANTIGATVGFLILKNLGKIKIFKVMLSKLSLV